MMKQIEMESKMFPNFDRNAPICVDCPEHETRITLDPDDWFCDDDITVSCKAADGRAIAPGIRPSSNGNTAWCRSGARNRRMRGRRTRGRMPRRRGETTVPMSWCFFMELSSLSSLRSFCF